MPNQVTYGFLNMQHLFNNRVVEVGEGLVNDAIQATMAEHNRQLNAMMDMFVFRTDAFQTTYKSGADARLQALDDNGRARPILGAVTKYTVGLPMFHAGAAWGSNRISLLKMTVEEANRITRLLINADARWMRDHLFAAIYNNAEWTFPDQENGPVVVKPLANGDSEVYGIQRGAMSASGDTHFFAQANAIDDANNPFPTIHKELIEHSENGGQVFALVPTNLINTVTALDTFYDYPDPNLTTLNTERQLIGTFSATEAMPGELRGYADGVWIVEWPSMPDNYIIALTTEGERPIAMREETIPELRGYAQVAIRADHPFWESQWERRAGFGAWNRVGAVVWRVGNGSYAIPTGYTTPMP